MKILIIFLMANIAYATELKLIQNGTEFVHSGAFNNRDCDRSSYNEEMPTDKGTEYNYVAPMFVQLDRGIMSSCMGPFGDLYKNSCIVKLVATLPSEASEGKCVTMTAPPISELDLINTGVDSTTLYFEPSPACNIAYITCNISKPVTYSKMQYIFGKHLSKKTNGSAGVIQSQKESDLNSISKKDKKSNTIKIQNPLPKIMSVE